MMSFFHKRAPARGGDDRISASERSAEIFAAICGAKLDSGCRDSYTTSYEFRIVRKNDPSDAERRVLLLSTNARCARKRKQVGDAWKGVIRHAAQH
jgi:hypothetical protein